MISAEQHTSDTLLDCLVALTAKYEQLSTVDGLLSGLPVVDKLTPSLFIRAAGGAGFDAQIASVPLQDIALTANYGCDAVLLLKEDVACILTAMDTDAATAEVYFPTSTQLPSSSQGDTGGEQKTIALHELEEQYLGSVIYTARRFHPQGADEHQAREGLSWFWRVIKQSRRLYADVLLAALFVNLFALAMPFFIMNVYDRVVPNHATDTLWMLALGVIVVLAGDAALRVMRGWFVDIAASRADIKLSDVIMARSLGLCLEQRPEAVGAFASRIQAFEAVRSFIGSVVVVALIDLPFFLLFLTIIGLISWYFSIPLLIGASIVLISSLLASRKMKRLSDQINNVSAQRNAGLIEGLTQLELIRSFDASHRTQFAWEQSTRFLSDKNTELKLLGSAVASGAAFVQQAVSVAVVIIGVYLIINGDISQGGLIAAYLLLSRAMAPVALVSGLITQFHHARAALQGLENIMGSPQERPPHKQWLSQGDIAGGLALRHVIFHYPSEQEEPPRALNEVSFSINAGERVAILGKVGSGKSTIHKLLLGLYQPKSGAVLVDGTNISQMDPSELRRHIAYVPQHSDLVQGTIYDNIVFGLKHKPSLDEVQQALDVSGLSTMLGSHAEGLMAQAGENGNKLSGGQRQAVCIARAVVRDAPILLLDEPTSDMDSQMELQVASQLRQYLQQGSLKGKQSDSPKGTQKDTQKGIQKNTQPPKTLLLITHKTALLELVDRLIVIDNGLILADGPKAEVLEALQRGAVQHKPVEAQQPQSESVQQGTDQKSIDQKDIDQKSLGQNVSPEGGGDE